MGLKGTYVPGTWRNDSSGLKIVGESGSTFHHQPTRSIPAPFSPGLLLVVKLFSPRSATGLGCNFISGLCGGKPGSNLAWPQMVKAATGQSSQVQGCSRVLTWHLICDPDRFVASGWWSCWALLWGLLMFMLPIVPGSNGCIMVSFAGPNTRH